VQVEMMMKNCSVTVIVPVSYKLLQFGRYNTPSITFDGHSLKYVNEVRYLGHKTTKRLCGIVRELRKSYTRINIIIRRISRCSTLVINSDCSEVIFCAFYDVALWKNFTMGSFNKLRSCYHKCIKIFFGYPKVHSVPELSLPSFVL